jgi:hypothetical protein
MLYVEVTIDKKKQLPAGAASALAIELNKRLQRKYPDAEATVRMASMDGLSVRQWHHCRQRSDRRDIAGNVGKCGRLVSAMT